MDGWIDRSLGSLGSLGLGLGWGSGLELGFGLLDHRSLAKPLSTCYVFLETIRKDPIL